MDISIFEIIGPVMLGPSSSGTAGMARLGRAASRFLDGEIKSIDLRFHKRNVDYAGLRSHCALIGGLMGYEADDPVIRESVKLAKSKGIKLTGSWFPDDADIDGHSVGMTVVQKDGRIQRVTGASVGGGSINIFGIDDFDVKLASTEDYLFVWSDKDISTELLNILRSANINSDISHDCKQERYLFYISVPKQFDENVLKLIKDVEGVNRVLHTEAFIEFGFVPHEPLFTSYDELIKLSEETGKNIPELTIEYEIGRSGRSREEIYAQMSNNLKLMKECVNYGLTEELHTLFGFDPGDNAKKMLKANESGQTLSGSTMGRAFAKAMSVMEMGESMNRIVAAPTGGSAGIVPGCILTVQEDKGFSDDKLVESLFVAAAMGVVMYYHHTSFSGMSGGCQGEIGVSSAMAAAALAYLGGGDTKECCHAMALAMKNILGLVCDRIGGSSEIPCTTRNCIGVGNAFAGCDMALAGIASYVSPDNVILALTNTQKLLPPELRGGCGALRCTPESAKATAIEKEICRSLALDEA